MAVRCTKQCGCSYQIVDGIAGKENKCPMHTPRSEKNLCWVDYVADVFVWSFWATMIYLFIKYPLTECIKEISVR